MPVPVCVYTAITVKHPSPVVRDCYGDLDSVCDRVDVYVTVALCASETEQFTQSPSQTTMGVVCACVTVAVSVHNDTVAETATHSHTVSNSHTACVV